MEILLQPTSSIKQVTKYSKALVKLKHIDGMIIGNQTVTHFNHIKITEPWKCMSIVTLKRTYDFFIPIKSDFISIYIALQALLHKTGKLP